MTTYNELKLGKNIKYIIFKLSDNNKEIVVEEASGDSDWENFRNKLVNATVKSPSVSRSFLSASRPLWLDAFRAVVTKQFFLTKGMNL